ncbi:MAG TPA: sulfatase-like hydrolase/transferase, partial [Acidimicrobiales bacterium]|nr:sulfatase-like hydrolase/transferase [Acidimicrobiales bacterium]
MRGRLLRTLPVVALVGLVLVVVGVASSDDQDGDDPAARGDNSRPNVVLILTDDQTVAQLAAMPKTRELLGGSGITFTNAVASYPLCCPARATILTGQYVQNNGVRQNLDTDAELELPTTAETEGIPEGEGYGAFVEDAEDRSLAVALEQSGYHTGLLGKYLNGYPVPGPVPPGWTDWRAAEEAPDSYWDTIMNINGTVDEYRDQFQTDLFADLAQDMIHDASASERPFFLHLNFSAPHLQSDSRPAYAPRHRDLYADARVPRTPDYNEPDFSDKPAFMQSRFFPLNLQQQGNLDIAYRNGFRSLRSVDDAVGQIVEQLELDGELENTYLVFTSDNGYAFGEHRLRQLKYLPYESIVRVPLIVAGPAVAPEQQGTESDLSVVNTDVAPTILEIAEVAPLAPVDGRSLVPILQGRPGAWQAGASSNPAHPRPVYLVGIAPNIPGAIPTYSGVRTSDGWKYVRWEDDEQSRELYDLDADPMELVNLAGRAAYREVEDRLERQRRLLARCAGRSCHAPPYGYLDLPREGGLPAWFEPARWADANGLGVAYSDATFRPERVPSRITALAWLWREAGRPTGVPPNPYVDVPASSDPMVDWAFAERIVRPTGDRRLRPVAALTRAQWADMVWRAVDRPGAGSTQLPSDVVEGNAAADAVRWLVSDPSGSLAPIVPLDDDRTFRPQSSITRADAVTWMHLAVSRR